MCQRYTVVAQPKTESIINIFIGVFLIYSFNKVVSFVFTQVHSARASLTIANIVAHGNPVMPHSSVDWCDASGGQVKLASQVSPCFVVIDTN